MMIAAEKEKELPRILLVEDDVELAELVEEYLTDNFFTVAHEPRGDRAVERILTEKNLARRLVRNGLEVAQKKFDWPIVLKGHEGAILSAIRDGFDMHERDFNPTS